MNKEFRYRGEEPTRIETLSDAGFALAIGLLLISTSPPTTFDELIEFTKDLVPFGLCIILISMVWFQHFIYFIRYGFRNTTIVLLNTLLLFLLLFYVYPLKFLTKFLVIIYSALLGIDRHAGDVLQKMIAMENIPSLMIIYGLGADGIFMVLMLMYMYALKKAKELELNELETFDTRASIYGNAIMAGIPLCSVLLAAIIPGVGWSSNLSGFIYILYWPLMSLYSRRVEKKRKLILDSQIS
jgi:uncharacterized membrane protein